MNIAKILKFHKVLITGVLAVTFMVLPFASVFAGDFPVFSVKGGYLIPASQAPEVTTMEATGVTADSAVLNASFDANNSPTDTWFTYGKTNLFGKTTPVVNQDSGSGSFNATITGLDPNTTYYFRAVAINENAAVNGGTLSFTTLSENDNNNGGNNSGNNVPGVTTKGATNVSDTQAILEASFDGNGSDTELWFQYGKTNTFGKTTPIISRGSGTGDISQLITGLEASTKYYFKAVAINENGVENGSTRYFTTTDSSSNNNNSNNNNSSNEVPEVITEPASNVEKTQAVLNASFDGNGSDVDVWFRYGKTTSLGKTTKVVNRSSGSGNFSQLITGLDSNTPYYFQAVAINDNGLTSGNILSLTTKKVDVVVNNTDKPTVTTTAASSIEKTSVVLNGIVDPNGADAKGWFEYGTTIDMNSVSEVKMLGSGTTAIELSVEVTDLEDGKIYYYRAVAQNEDGIQKGKIKIVKVGSTTFTTTTVSSSANSESSSLVSLKIETLFEEMTVGDIVEYTVTYKNNSGQDLKDAILRVILPSEISFRKATEGNFSSSDHALIVNLETIEKGDEGKIHLQTQIDKRAQGKEMLVVTAVIIFSEEDGTQDQSIAYVLHKMKAGENANLLGAAALFGGGFLPNTLAGWLVVILILGGLVFLGQHLYQVQLAKKGIKGSKSGNGNGAEDDIQITPEEITPEEVKQSFSAFNNRQINK